MIKNAIMSKRALYKSLVGFIIVIILISYRFIFGQEGIFINMNLDNPFEQVHLFSNEIQGSFNKDKNTDFLNVWDQHVLQNQSYWNYRGFSDLEINQLSTLGRRLFLHEKIGSISNKTFLINIYKYGKAIERRLMKSGNIDPFYKCSVNNCRISYLDEDFNKADAVLFHLHRMTSAPRDIERKNFEQRWVWLSDESSLYTLVSARDKNINHFDGLFNWSMTYRFNSDVPVPYGRVIPSMNISNVTPEQLDVFSRKTKLVAIMGSHCSGANNRWDFVKYLKQFIKVDIYGKCGSLRCTSRELYHDCPLLNDYKFYLALENSNCLEYITEKVWWHALNKQTVPVVMGAAKEDYEKHLPPNSFIYAEDFKSPDKLASYLIYLSQNKTAYNAFHEWRLNFHILNEHGYFGADIQHYCRLCEALNYNDPKHKTFSKMKDVWDSSWDCYAPRWQKPPSN